MGKKKKVQHRGTAAILAAEKAGVNYQLTEITHSSHLAHGYALDTAEQLHVDPVTVFKTLMAEVDGHIVCAVVPAIGVLNLKSLARAAGGKKAEMLAPADAERVTGYVTGGISPVGQKHRSPTFIDITAQELPLMRVSGGKRNLSMELSPTDLAKLTGAKFAQIMDKRHF